jgi:hypothetical protein
MHPCLEPGWKVCTLRYESVSNGADRVRISKGEELNIVLLKLVEYLGHSNPMVSGVAFTEV